MTKKADRRIDFGLADLFGVSFDKKVEGPMQNSYLRLKKDADQQSVSSCFKGSGRCIPDYQYHLSGESYPRIPFPHPVTLIPTYPDLPMEDVYPRIPETDIRGLYLNDIR